MPSFLVQVVQYLSQNIDNIPLAQACVVLPTRRASEEIGRILKQAACPVMPYVTHIEHFIPEIYFGDSQERETSHITLLLELYDIFHSIEKNTELEKFTTWGYILLKDFDQIDRNLVDAEALFSNLYDIKNIERWSPEQGSTPRIDRYFQLWEHLAETYTQFRNYLQTHRQGYAGMMYRALAENVKHYLVDNQTYKHYFFVGFNYLSKAEEKIISTLVAMKKATFLADTDSYYMKYSQENKAGTFLKKYKNTWLKGQFLFENTDLLTTEKKIHFISTSNASIQGKIANQLLKNWQITSQNKKTVVVLADENILLPVVHAIDKSFEGMNITMGLPLKNSALFNFVDVLFEQYSMRYTFKDQATGRGEVKYSYRTILKLLNHPFVRQYERKQRQKELTEQAPQAEKQGSILQNIIWRIHEQNRIYLSQAELVEMLAELNISQQDLRQKAIHEDKNEALLAEKQPLVPDISPYKLLFEALFRTWQYPIEAIENFEELMSLLNPQENVFEAKYFEQFMDILHNLKRYILRRRRENSPFPMRTFRIFLYQAFREATVPLDSNEDTILQIMGLLETRTLDFENVIILSANETILPKSKKHNSFIPLDIAMHYGLPTYQEQNALTSYHFFRLLQRSQSIAIVYVLPSDTYGGEEKSRFIYQIENDLVRANPQIRLYYAQATPSHSQNLSQHSISIPKTPEVLAKIYQKIEQGLTPSYINMFIECQLKYYFNQIADIGLSAVADESLKATQFGTLIHEILEEIYRQFANNKQQIGIVELTNAQQEVENIVSRKLQEEAYKDYILVGKNYIQQKITVEYINNFLQEQIEELQNIAPDAHFQIIALENKAEQRRQRQSYMPLLSTQFEVKLHNKTLYPKLQGVIDRIDSLQNQIRIIDYKTGNIDEKDFKLIQEEEDNYLTQKPEGNMVRQLWLYKYILAKKLLQDEAKTGFIQQISPQQHITAGIYNLQKPEQQFLEVQYKETKKSNTAGQDHASAFIDKDLEQYVQKSEQYLTTILAEMIDPEKQIVQTDKVQTCQYCNYQNICLRG